MNLSLELQKRRNRFNNPLVHVPLPPLNALRECLVKSLGIAVEQRDDRLHFRTLDGDPCTLEYVGAYLVRRTLHGVEDVSVQQWLSLNLSLCRHYMSIECQGQTPVINGLIVEEASQELTLKSLAAFFNLSNAAKHTAH
ncbi:hypothetical protein AWM79_03495 [Pseudomonas agarici]|uniref:Uncharacterized protein n=1 Tax=Pseudomonas agarici TaxID=46677 RepID=A0A0X1SXF5_PSEAA|nr:hypothetical protein [Pseudomonas agarici]AMB84418.1 hypothetical protein AWM79_03495 [Pseudomonas agarici]NWB89614.1 hypothetical protein [Pseudomonas agarici]NWC10326.1 hypothetical protein [Pseudomonas agarici]SEK21200.1 hypothetical protein SAMN05216604_101185 [Pseudomonas agarici]